MITLQIILSITAMVLQNCIFNGTCKKDLKTNNHIYRFNMIMYSVCIVIFGISLIKSSISLYTVALATVFGVVTALSNLYKMSALSSGPMHITLLITTSSMIIPTMSGIFWGEDFSLAKLIFVLLLIWFIYLSLNKNDSVNVKKHWFL